MSLLKSVCIVLLSGLMIACGGGGGGTSDPITKSSSSSISSVALSPQLLTFAEQIVVELQVGETVTNLATGQGTGSITYKSSDNWIATVDDAGFVMAKNPGRVTITATKAADSHYLAATASYSLTISAGMYLNAWIGSSDTLINFPAFAKGAELYRSSSGNCDFSNYASCPDSLLTVLQNLTVNDAAHLDSAGYFLLKSANGKANASVNLKSHFSPRGGQAIVNFKGRLWIIGGQYEDEYKNDIWSSVDGIYWNLETPTAAFSPRTMHKVVENNGRLYLTGGIVGYDGNSNLFVHDIWSSSDGVNWTLETDHPAFSYRWDMPFISFNNKLWVIGGINTGPWVKNNDIWSSVDGKNWTLELASAVFSPRSGHKLITFKNKLWMIGSDEEQKDIWSSIDGINWVKEAETTGFLTTMQLLTPVVHDNKLWLLGDNPQYIWFSEDGVTWTQAPAEASYSERFGERAKVLTFDNQIWLIGGEVIHDKKRSMEEVWASTDAHKWKLKTNGAAFTRRIYHKVISHNGNLFLIGGQDASSRKLNDVWSSANGINWDIRTASAAFAPRITQKVASFNNKLWLIGEDFAGGYADDLWTSDDGVTWLKESDDIWKLTEPSARTHQLFTFNNELWLLGSVERNEVRIPALWSSKDGMSWQIRTSTSGGSAAVPGFYPDNRGHQVIVFKNKLWIIYAGLMPQVWSSADGAVWKNENLSGGLWEHTDYQLVVFKDKIWMIGGSDFTQGGFGVPAKDIWSSSDGVSWKQEVSVTDFPARGGHQVVTFNDQLLLYGGAVVPAEGGEGSINNDVWSSTDGIEWRRGYQTPLNFIQ